MKKFAKTLILLLIVFIILFLLVGFVSIRPLAWKPPTANDSTLNHTLNEKLITTQKISLGGWYGPEDITFDSSGNLYCGVHTKENDFSDGRILKIDPAGRIEVFYDAGSWVSGLHFDDKGNLIALSHKEGLIRISPDKRVKILANTDENNKPFLIPNGLDIASDGKIYFSNTSENAAYDIKYGRKIILEMRPLGGLYCYDPKTSKVKTLINGTYFGNGVVLSKDETHILMVETAKYRVLRYWLSGPKKGETEIFMENLPGFPNGISGRNDGSYWIGFSTKRNVALDRIHSKPPLKRLVYSLPEFLQPKAEKFGLVMNVSPEGAILKSYFDTKGSIMPETGAVKEYDGHLYLGGDVLPHIGKFTLEGSGK